MKIGTKSVLFGAHCFFIHPWFVAAAWTKLYGFPWDPRLWVAFFLHDLGYWGKPNLDGPEGETHPEWAAKIMGRLFDDKWASCPACFSWSPENSGDWPVCAECTSQRTRWRDLCLYHSRYYAKSRGAQPSRLCFADKLSFALTPWWLYLPMVTATGEINEYLKNAQKSDSEYWKPTGNDKRLWHRQLREYMKKWVEEHRNGTEDTWTKVRHG